MTVTIFFGWERQVVFDHFGYIHAIISWYNCVHSTHLNSFVFLWMASIRRTLFPVPRAGTVASVEVCSVASPLSKSSSSPQSSPPSGGLLSSVSSMDSRAFVLGVFSPRYLRAVERSKPKGQLWRKVLFHFSICFMVGVSIGLIPLASTNLSMNLMSKHQDLTFEVISTVGNFRSLENVKINETPLVDEAVKFNATFNSAVKENKLIDGVAYNVSNSQFNEDPYMESQKLLIIVTPTYNHQFQAYYLHRLSQTLKLVPPPLLWIVVEMTSQSEETADILRSSGIMYRHLICKMNLTNTSHKSILLRNVAIAHIKTHRLDGIVYFADDDNIYSVELFHQMREIRRFGTWTVARLSGDRSGIVLQGPICNGSQVIGWHINNESDGKSKRFHAETPGFAFNSTILWDPKKWHRPTLEPIRQLESVQENLWVSTLIEQVVEDESQMQGLMNNCSRVMVWHVDLGSSYSFYPQKWITENNLDVIFHLPLV